MSSSVHPISAQGGNVASTDTQEPDSELSTQYDYVMVFKLEQEENGQRQQTAAAKDCMKSMIAAGLEIFPYQSVQKDEIYVLIRAPVRRLLACLYLAFLLTYSTDSVFPH